MRPYIKIENAGTIEDAQDREDLILVTDSQDVEAIKQHIGDFPDLEDFDGFFVTVEDGEYGEVYGFSGSVAYLYKTIYQIEWGLTE